MEKLLAEIRNQGQPLDAAEPVEDLISIESIKRFSSWVEGRGYLDSGELSIEDVAIAAAVEHRTVRNYIERLRQKGEWPYERHYITTTVLNVSPTGLKRGNGTRVRYLKPEEVFKLLTATPLGRFWNPGEMLDDAQTREERAAQLEEDIQETQQEAKVQGLRVREGKWKELERCERIEDDISAAPTEAEQLAMEEAYRQEQVMLAKVLEHKKAKQQAVLRIPTGPIERTVELLEEAEDNQLVTAQDILEHYKRIADLRGLMEYSSLWIREDDLVTVLGITKRWLKGKTSFRIHGMSLVSETVGMFKYWRIIET